MLSKYLALHGFTVTTPELEAAKNDIEYRCDWCETHSALAEKLRGRKFHRNSPELLEILGGFDALGYSPADFLKEFEPELSFSRKFIYFPW